MLSSISNFEAATIAPEFARRVTPALTPARQAHRSAPRVARSAGPADRVPRDMGRAWLIGLVGAVAILAALEFTCRRLGLRPMVKDDERLWALARDNMRPDDPDQIALVGTSRTHQDFDPKIFSHEMNGAPVAQLAVDGSTGLLVLDDLSRDEHFRGLVVLDVVPWAVFGNMNYQDPASRAFLDYHGHESWATAFEGRIRVVEQLAFAFHQLNFRNLVRDIRKHRRPNWSQAYISEADRTAGVHWSLTTSEQMEVPQAHLMTATTCVPPSLLPENLKTLETMIKRIEARGGRVALVVLPSTGIVGDHEHAFCPRDRYWDVLAAETSAVTFNWMDDPRLSKFKCPDGSHLDMRDQPEFTRIVVEDLREKLRARQLNP